MGTEEKMKEEEAVEFFYATIDENTRLTSTKAAEIEFLTTIRVIEKHIRKGMKILDVGAGAGIYSLYLAKLGYDVTSVDVSNTNIQKMKEKMKPEYNWNVVEGNAKNLSSFKDNYFDIVLCMGPLYHIAKREEQLLCIYEVNRVLKEYGMAFFAFISNDMVIANMTMAGDLSYIEGNLYNHTTFQAVDNVLIFHTLEQAQKLVVDSNMNIAEEVGVDGLSEMLANKINQFTKEEYEKWLQFHFYCSEKPEMLGLSSHILIVSEKKT